MWLFRLLLLDIDLGHITQYLSYIPLMTSGPADIDAVWTFGCQACLAANQRSFQRPYVRMRFLAREGSTFFWPSHGLETPVTHNSRRRFSHFFFALTLFLEKMIGILLSIHQR